MRTLALEDTGRATAMAGWVRTIDFQLEKLTTMEEYRNAMLAVRDYLEVHGPRGHVRIGGEPVHCGRGDE